MSLESKGILLKRDPFALDGVYNCQLCQVESAAIALGKRMGYDGVTIDGITNQGE